MSLLVPNVRGSHTLQLMLQTFPHQWGVQSLHLTLTLCGVCVRAHRLRAQTHKTVSPLALHVRCKPRLSSVLLTTCYRSEVPKSPPYLSSLDHRIQANTFTSSVKGMIKDADE